jgi:hypothetical protein
MPGNFQDGVINQSYDYPGDAFPTNGDTVRWFFVDIRYLGPAATQFPLTVSPAIANSFTNGVSSNNIFINGLATNVTLLANDGLGHTGLSNPFNVGYVPGYFDHFAWSAIANPQTNAVPFAVTVSALDHFNGVVTNINETAVFTTTGFPGNLTISPPSGNFVLGVWSGSITLMPAGSNVVLYATDGLNRTAASNPFNLVDPPLLPPVLLGVSLNSNAFQFGWSAVPGHPYQLQYITNLSQTNWINLGLPTNATDVQLWFVQPVGPGPQRFFRLQLQ